jgi:DNA-binding NarL/FixJ family response regulator
VNTVIDKKAPQIKVLLVDDKPTIRKGLEMRLSLERDIEVIGAAENGSQAVDAVGQLQPEVVIMDYIMPIMDGLQATAVIKKEYPATSVIILSIEDSPGLRAKAMEAGAWACVAKRQGTDKLLLEIRGAAGR